MFMAVSMVQVRIMRVSMHKRRMPMPMGVHLTLRIARPMFVLMVFIMLVPMLMLHRLMLVFMLMAFCQVQP